jgi:CheY-like chemotaxis protein/anti-sigma regulatory factor (Ser/Thr protein kinase)
MAKPARRARRRPRAVSNDDQLQAPTAPANIDRAIEAVIASFAHEIRTPLTGVLAVADLLGRSPIGERESTLIEILKSSAEHISALSSLVIDGVRARRKGLVLQQDLFDLHLLAHRLAAALDARGRLKGLTCSTSIAEDLPAAMIGDQVRLRAAVENLIDNAVKFTDAGEVNLDISAVGGQVCFAVTDSGVGLTAAEARRLFRPFIQADDTVAERFGGAGLGLAFVRRVARAMGGDVTAAANPGGGSVFTLTVALHQTEQPPRKRSAIAKSTPAKRPRKTAAAAEPAVRLNILCAEDNIFGRVVIKTILAELGHAVTFVGSGVGAVAAASRRHRYDLVLMDIELAGLDGIEATRRIRALPGQAGQIPVIGISGRADKEEAAHAAGMDAFLRKPVKSGKLASALALVTRRAASRPARREPAATLASGGAMQAES